MGNEVTRVKTAFEWCYENRVIKEPVYFGSEFREPPRKAVRRHRRESGKKLFTAEDIWKLLDEAGLHLRAMILLGINCGYGPHDCATLPLSAVDPRRAWIVLGQKQRSTEYVRYGQRQLTRWQQVPLAVRDRQKASRCSSSSTMANRSQTNTAI
ncbi:MAG: hypothetical protein VXZ82_03595 [Planctomycetota bacterium]|nr:hypothetical protein [Planctomycetota bacterium]